LMVCLRVLARVRGVDGETDTHAAVGVDGAAVEVLAFVRMGWTRSGREVEVEVDAAAVELSRAPLSAVDSRERLRVIVIVSA
jgi:hypothetical protein